MRKLAVLNVTLLVVGFLLTTAMLSPAQTLTVLHTFTGPEGAAPMAPLVLGHDGNYYGTTFTGGRNSLGNVFKMTPAGSVTDLYDFCSQAGCTDGVEPEAGLVLGSDGNFYGTTSAGGPTGGGVVFKITSGGSYTVIHNFCSVGGCLDGGASLAPLVLASDGNFYGTAVAGGANQIGVIFRISPGGTYTKLYSFDQTHGENPHGLIQARDGLLYGTTEEGGANGYGTVYKTTLSGSVTLLYTFCGTPPCVVDGGQSYASLVQGADGNFYGTTFTGGADDYGTVYKITSSGTLTTLHSFTLVDGGQLIAPLLLASDGTFYGNTTIGGTTGAGTLFSITPGGGFALLYSLNGQSEGAHPMAALVQAGSNGFIGTANAGGSHNDGTIFELMTSSTSPTTTVLTSMPNPSNLGEDVTMTATVTAQSGLTPTGNVEFKSNGTSIGTVMLTNGVAVLHDSNLPLGTDSLVAMYQGANGFGPSTSNTVQQMVFLPLSTTTVTSVPNPSTFGQQVTITATVGPSGPPVPTGTVDFDASGHEIFGCTGVPLQGQMAVCMTTSLATGTDPVFAVYSGDSNYQGSEAMLTQIVNPVPSPVQFMSVTPCRVVDTRNPNGPFGGPVLARDSTRSFPLSEADNPCGIPQSALAFALNVTVVPRGHLGYLTIWPVGQGQPVVSTLNAPDGRVKANAAIVPAGDVANGVNVYVTDSTDVILDIDGYFAAPGQNTFQFYALTPCRVIDTRGPTGHLGGPFLHGGRNDGTHRDFPVRESSCIPQSANIAAYSMNFTVVPHTQGQPLGYLTVWPEGGNQPLVSTLNNPTATVVANAAIVPAGTGGGISAFAYDDTDLIVDINGYFGAPSQSGLSFYTLTPCRAYDSRNNNGQPFQGTRTVDVVDSQCGPPSSAQAYVFNATVVPTNGPMGYLTLWPDGQTQPVVSTLNAYDGFITSNMAIVPNVNGSIDAYADGMTHLILDIAGYFAP